MAIKDLNSKVDTEVYNQKTADLESKIALKADKTVASTSVNGLMSSTDKTKLNGIATNANNYVHPTTSGNKHIPSGGTSGQVLKWSADGTATWANDNNTTYTAGTGLTLSGTTFSANIGTGSSQVAAGNHTHSYLPLSGGTLTNQVTVDLRGKASSIKSFNLISNSSNEAILNFSNNSNASVGYFGYKNGVMELTTNNTSISASSGTGNLDLKLKNATTDRRINLTVNNSNYSENVMSIGLKELLGTTTGDVTVKGEIYCREDGKGIGMGVGRLNDDVFIINEKAEHYLNLSDTGTIQYAGSYLVRENQPTFSNIVIGDNACIKTARTENGVVNQYNIYTKSGGTNDIDLGDINLALSLHAKATPSWWDGTTIHKVNTSHQADFVRSGGNYTIRTTDSSSLLFANNNNDKHFALSNTDTYCNFYSNCDGGYRFDKNIRAVHSIRIDEYDVPHCNKNFVPLNNGHHWIGVDGQAWWGMRVTGGGFGQSSDREMKEDIRDVDDKTFFDMIKNTKVHSYLYKEMNDGVAVASKRTQETVDEDNLNIGIVAQELAECEGSEYILTKGESDSYTVNLYNFSSAIMSALRYEISKREELESYIKTLESRLSALESK